MIVLGPMIPLATVNAAGLVPDCGKIIKVEKKDASGNVMLDKDKQPIMESVVAEPCNFNSFMTLINNVINFLLFVLATPLVVIILIYAGFNLITSGGSAESITKAKKMIKNVIIGYIIALVAWLVVHAILTSFGFTGPMFLVGK